MSLRLRSYVLAPHASTEAVASKLGPLSGNLHSHVRNLGVTFYSALTFDKQINAVVRSCFYQLKNIAKMKSFLTLRDMESVIHPFISSRLDYCNGLSEVESNELHLLALL